MDRQQRTSEFTDAQTREQYFVAYEAITGAGSATPAPSNVQYAADLLGISRP